METRNIVNFYGLNEKWKVEAISNLDDMAEETMYLEPEDDAIPEKHILWDLSECMPRKGVHAGFEYNAVITISNNSGMLLNIDENFETCTIKFV
jgi:hypothetical protein